MSKQYLVFNLNKELYGISIQSVKEIRAWEKPRQLYGTPPYVFGIINLRRVSVPIIDLQAYLGGSATQDLEKCVVMILNLQDQLIGMVVDDVSDIMNIDEEQISCSKNNAMNQQFLKGTYNDDEKTILLFSDERLFREYIVNQQNTDLADTAVS